MQVPEERGGGIALLSSSSLFKWGQSNSVWFLSFGTACCAIEMMAANATHYDFERFGVMPRATPRQADLMIVAGTITKKMAPLVVRLYEQMPEPKYVIAMGGCAISGGPFYYDSYTIVRGVDQILPVDIYIPGCAPRPEALYYGVMELQKKIRAGEAGRGEVTAFGRELLAQSEAAAAAAAAAAAGQAAPGRSAS